MSLSVGYSIVKTKSNLYNNNADNKQKIIDLCNLLIELGKYRMEMLLFLESTMTVIAPNVCEIIGAKCTSKLISAVGGIVELSKIPASNI